MHNCWETSILLQFQGTFVHVYELWCTDLYSLSGTHHLKWSTFESKHTACHPYQLLAWEMYREFVLNHLCLGIVQPDFWFGSINSQCYKTLHLFVIVSRQPFKNMNYNWFNLSLQQTKKLKKSIVRYHKRTVHNGYALNNGDGVGFSVTCTTCMFIED